jgi:hypothetical protein
MQNIVKLQDQLRMQPDAVLIQLMQSPREDVPQFLVAGILKERETTRNEAKQAPEGTVADEIIQQAQQPQGLMNLPDETLAGAAMRARISGQQQQAPDGMVAMPPQGAPPQGMPPQGMPQGMADGGAVTFGNIFGNQNQNTTMVPEAEPQKYMPKNGYVAPATTDYSNLRHQFDGRPTPQAYNPRVRMSDAKRYGIPEGMAAPTYGTPGLNRTFTGREGQNTKYSWANDAARDAYIRYMTPPAAPAKTMADGGVAHFDGTERSDVSLPPQDPMSSYMYSMFEDPNDPFGIRQNFGTPSAPVSGAPPSRDKADPMSSGIGALTGDSFLSGLKEKYTGMTQEPPATQPIPKVNAYAFEPTPTQDTPVEKLRDYAGETKSEINKLLEGLSGDSEALKQRDRDMALAQAGFAIAASKNPNAFGAIGEGAQTGIADYVKSRKEAKALDAERIKAQIAAASSAGEMGQRQGLTEAEMGQRDRISNREVGSRERLAKAQLAQAAEIANIDAILKGRANDIDANYKNKVLEMDTDEQRLYASLDPLKQGDIGRGFAVSNAFKLISTNNDTINNNFASPEARAAAEKANAGLYKIIGISDDTAFDASKYTPGELAAIKRYGSVEAARAAGMIQ